MNPYLGGGFSSTLIQAFCTKSDFKLAEFWSPLSIEGFMLRASRRKIWKYLWGNLNALKG
jgi:hypothetical protein